MRRSMVVITSIVAVALIGVAACGPPSMGGGKPGPGGSGGTPGAPSGGSASAGPGGPADAGSSGGGGVTTFRVLCDSEPHRPRRPDRPPEHARHVPPAPVLRQPDDERRFHGPVPRQPGDDLQRSRRQLGLLGADAVPERRRRARHLGPHLLPGWLTSRPGAGPVLPGRPAHDRRQRRGHRATAGRRRGLDVPGCEHPVDHAARLRRRDPRAPAALPRLLGRRQPGLGRPQEPHGVHGQRRLPEQLPGAGPAPRAQRPLPDQRQRRGSASPPACRTRTTPTSSTRWNAASLAGFIDSCLHAKKRTPPPAGGLPRSAASCPVRSARTGRRAARWLAPTSSRQRGDSWCQPGSW